MKKQRRRTSREGKVFKVPLTSMRVTKRKTMKLTP